MQAMPPGGHRPLKKRLAVNLRSMSQGGYRPLESDFGVPSPLAALPRGSVRARLRPQAPAASWWLCHRPLGAAHPVGHPSFDANFLSLGAQDSRDFFIFFLLPPRAILFLLRQN